MCQSTADATRHAQLIEKYTTPPASSTGATLADQVKELEAHARSTQREAGEAKATLLLNFGPDGRTQAGLVTDAQSLTGMVCSVFDYYNEALKQANLGKHGLSEVLPTM